MAVKRFEIGKAYFWADWHTRAYVCISRRDGIKRPYAVFRDLVIKEEDRRDTRYYLHEKDGAEVIYIFRDMPVFSNAPYDAEKAAKMIEECRKHDYANYEVGTLDKLVTKHIRKHKAKKLLRAVWSFVRAWWRSMRWLMSRSGYSARARPRTSSESK